MHNRAYPVLKRLKGEGGKMLAYAMLTLSLTGIGFLSGAFAQAFYGIIDGSVPSVTPEAAGSLQWHQRSYSRTQLCGDLSYTDRGIIIVHDVNVLGVASPGKMVSRRLRLKLARLRIDLVKLDGRTGRAIKAYILTTNPNRDALLHVMKRVHIAHEIID